MDVRRGRRQKVWKKKGLEDASWGKTVDKKKIERTRRRQKVWESR